MITLKTSLTKLLVLTFIAATILVFASSVVFSQSPSPRSSPTGSPVSADFQYPIKELGECKDLGTCTKYCEDPVHYNGCSNFAKKNGFYKDDKTTYATDKLWQDTKKELGCDSRDSCVNFCSDSSHFDACSSYAKRSDLPGGYTHEPDKSQYVESAKTTLGCDSGDSCAKFCDDPANASKCSDFANKVGLQGGTVVAGPGGCQTPETCGAYCSDPNNIDQCKPFTPGGNFAGPGGCTDEASCRNHCEQNPTDCRSYAPGTNGTYVPVECPSGKSPGPGGVCTATGDTSKATSCVGADKYWNGSSCQDSPPTGVTTDVPSAHFEPRPDMGGCKTPGECYDYCSDNPGKCGAFDVNLPRPTDEYTPYLYYTPGTEVTHKPIESMGGCTSPAGCYDYCSDNPGKCGGFSDKAPRPPEIYIPNTYYTPPVGIAYVTPPTTGFYTTPIYYTPPQGSTYTTPQYYTPGTYSTPSYQTPPTGSNYTTPNYYTPWAHYPTPSGQYPTPTYSTPTYYTPPGGTNYTTPYYYTPPPYISPFYFPSGGDALGYATPTYSTPPPYSTPQYYTPWEGGGYTTPVYYTPPTYTTPTYYTPPIGSKYTTPSYYTPPPPYSTPNYYTPGTYPTPPQYLTPPPYTTPAQVCPVGTKCDYYTPVSYGTPTYYTPTPYSTPSYYSPYASPSYFTPHDINYTSPSYYTPYTTPNYHTPSYYSPSYYTPGGTYTSPYYTPGSGYTSPTDSYTSPGTYYSPYYSPSGVNYYYPTPGAPYSTPTYPYPTPGSGYATPFGTNPEGTYYTPGSTSYTYPSPTTYYTPGGYTYPTPGASYAYPTPAGSYGYPTPGYPTPSGTYGTPSYGTPSYPTPSYGTPSYGTPSYGTPEPYGTPSYGTPSYGTPYATPPLGVSTSKNWLQIIWENLTSR